MKGQISFKLLCVLLFVGSAFGSDLDIYVNGGTRAVSVGNAYTALCDAADAVFWNPARMHSDKRVNFAANYARMYGVGGLYNFSSAFTLSFSKWALGVGWNGNILSDVYGENVVLLGVSRSVSRSISLGGAAKGIYISAPGYLKYSDPSFRRRCVALTLSLALDCKPLYNLDCALVLDDLLEPEVSLLTSTAEKDRLRREIRLGLAYHLQQYLVLSADLAGGFDMDDWRFNIGTEVRFFGALALRSGFSNGRLGLGVGLFAKNWKADFGVYSHRVLGNRYQFSIKLRR